MWHAAHAAQKEELSARRDELAAENAAALQPLIAAVQEEVVDLQSALEAEKARVVSTQKELDACHAQVARVRWHQCDRAELLACTETWM
jgi:chromosome segregation ATPase